VARIDPLALPVSTSSAHRSAAQPDAAARSRGGGAVA